MHKFKSLELIYVNDIVIWFGFIAVKALYF